MTTRLLDYDPLRGIAAWWRYEPHTDSAIITHTQDVSSVLEANKRAANDDEKTKRGIKRDWWKVASIPDIVWLKWKQEKGVDIFDQSHTDAILKLLNDPEYRYLKTTAKRPG